MAIPMKRTLARVATTAGGAAGLVLVVFLAVFYLQGGEMSTTIAVFAVGLISLVVLVRPEFGLHLLVMNSVAAYSVFFEMPRIGPMSIVIAIQGIVLLAVLVHLSVLQRGVYVNVPENWLLLAYSVLVLASILLAEHAGTHNYQLFRQAFLVGLVAYFVILQLIDSPAKLRRMVGVLVLVDLMLVLSGVLHKMGLFTARGMDPERIAGRTVGFLGNPNSMAFTLIGLFPLVLALLIHSRGFWARCLLAPLVVGNLFVILNTLSRGGFIALGVALLLLLVRFGRDRRLVLLLAAVVASGWLLLPAALFERFEEVRSLRGNDRYSLTVIGLNMAAHNPFLGVGYGNFERYFARYDTIHRGGATAPHNMYTSIASQCGVPSLILYLVIMTLAWRRLSRLFVRFRSRGERYPMLVVVALQSGLVSLLVFGLTGHVEHEYLVFVNLGLTLAIDRVYGRPDVPVPHAAVFAGGLPMPSGAGINA